jgi:tRNA-2-methylthio-N6-dimethylallyladenosine synthase
MFEEGNKVIDEGRQGSAYTPSPAISPSKSKESEKERNGDGEIRKLYLESYGCAMNMSDSEIVASIMSDSGFQTIKTSDDADVIFLNTCAIRDNAEQRIWNRLRRKRTRI